MDEEEGVAAGVTDPAASAAAMKEESDIVATSPHLPSSPAPTAAATTTTEEMKINSTAALASDLDAKLEALLARRASLTYELKQVGSSSVIPAGLSAATEAHEEKTRTLDGAGAHWDYLLKEMSWMSNDFRVERKWKVGSAKKLGKELHRAFAKREVSKKREFQQRQANLKKTANRVAREVKKAFWDKVDRVVLFKSNAEYFAEQQEIMDRNLERLLAQTERYTASLIANASNGHVKSTTALTVADVAKREAYMREREERELESMQQLIAQYSSDAATSAVALGKRANSKSKRSKKRLKLEEEEEEEEDEEDESFGEDEVSEEEEEDIDEEDEANPDDDGDAGALEEDMEIPLEELMRQRDAAIAAEEAEMKSVASGDGENGSSGSGSSEDEEEEEEEDESSSSGSNAEESSIQEDEPKRTTSTELVPSAAAAAAAEPFSVPTPFLLSKSRPLRAYQRQGLDWLVSLYDRHLNGILADEMGLGKTAQTISLLAHLAGSRGVWGPHLIIVPTSVILNWDLEFKMWCPGLKVLTYFGSTAERAAKRAGWTKPNAFHVCITSYQLAVQDATIFKRKRWIYMIADEAHNLKNPKSQRWQTLLSFQAKRRLLITGTPLQNSLMELWSLMHFLMPHVFRSQHEFRHWFSNPLQAIVESTEGNKSGSASGAVKRLHAIMRPFILRRLKQDVASQLPSKHEHIVRFPLARRQRLLYEEFVNLSSTQDALTSGGYMGMMSVLMKLRMCCNHPDLFEPRLVASSFCSAELVYRAPKCAFNLYQAARVPFYEDTLVADVELATRSRAVALRARELMPATPELFIQAVRIAVPRPSILPAHVPDHVRASMAELYQREVDARRADKLASMGTLIAHNARRLVQAVPVFGQDLVRILTVAPSQKSCGGGIPDFLYLRPSLEQVLDELNPVLERFVFCTPAVQASMRAPVPLPNMDEYLHLQRRDASIREGETLLRAVRIRQTISFPDRYLLQFDSGKLQTLAIMLHRLKQGKHRVLIFTQMTKMLDLLERFLNLHSHTYFRLDGSTKVEDRQSMMERFNRDERIFCFILSTRSGGLGINLTGADTVIFFDSDWNPQMDAQATDRAHRIGQTREVHIYRLIAEQTVEENILLKSNQKRHLSRLSVEEGNFTGSSAALLLRDQEEEERAMAQVEDESDQLATLRAKQEEEEIEKGDAEEDGLATTATTTTTNNTAAVADKKIEDEQGNILMTVQQYQDLESRLTPIDLYAMEFRQKYAVVVDKLKEARRQKELERQSEMAAQQEEDWELDKLEHERQLAEEEAEEDLIQSRVLPEWEAELLLQAKRRAFALERKLRKMTGRAWRKTFCKQLHKEGRAATNTELAYYLNEDTGETAWERPRVLDFEQERKQTRLGGFAHLPQAVLVRLARFVPREGLAAFRSVCLSFWRAGEDPLACWVVPQRRALDGVLLTVGSRVEVKEDENKENCFWYAGTIVDARAEDCIILYNEGTLERGVDWTRVRADTGARLTIIRGKKLGGPVFEMYNPTLASQFAGGTPALAPFQVDGLGQVLVQQQQRACSKVIVLCAGAQVMPAHKHAFAHSLRIVGEAFYMRERGAYALGNERIVFDDQQTAARVAGDVFDPNTVDAVDLARASVLTSREQRVLEWILTSSVRIRVDGVVFAAPMLLTGSSSTTTVAPRFVFRDCVFQRGICIADDCMASFEACQFVGNTKGPGALVGNQATAVFTQCSFRANLVAVHALPSARIVSMASCEIVHGNVNSPAVVGPVTQISTVAAYKRPSYGVLSIHTRGIRLPNNAMGGSATKKRAMTAGEEASSSARKRGKRGE